jgi:transposase
LNWQGERFPSNLTKGEWARLGPLIPAASPGGQPRKTDMWAVMNAILYLPRDSFPPHSTGPEHLPQISGRWVWEAIWTEIAHDASRTLWVGRQHNRRRVRQPVAEVGRGSGKTMQGGYDTAKK